MKNKFLFIAATHGNEGFSVPVLENLEQNFPKKDFNYDWIIGNEQAYKKNIRFTEEDMNRSAPGDKNSKVYEERRVAEIMDLSKQYDFVIDIHGTESNCGITSLIPYPTLVNLMIASLLHIQKSVIWYAKQSIEKGPVVQFTSCPGIEIECGPKNLPKISEQLQSTLEDFLKLTQSLTMGEILTRGAQKEFYVVYDKLEGEHDDAYTDFAPKMDNGQTFYPYLSNRYPNIICYKLKKVTISDLFLY